MLPRKVVNIFHLMSLLISSDRSKDKNQKGVVHVRWAGIRLKNQVSFPKYTLFADYTSD